MSVPEALSCTLRAGQKTRIVLGAIVGLIAFDRLRRELEESLGRHVDLAG